MRAMKLHLSFLVVALAGCAGFPTIEQERQDVSAAYAGCPPREIAITNNERLTWTATCRGKSFQCKAGDGTSCAAMR